MAFHSPKDVVDEYLKRFDFEDTGAIGDGFVEELIITRTIPMWILN